MLPPPPHPTPAFPFQELSNVAAQSRNQHYATGQDRLGGCSRRGGDDGRIAHVISSRHICTLSQAAVLDKIFQVIVHKVRQHDAELGSPTPHPLRPFLSPRALYLPHHLPVTTAAAT
jgi:hypothetical protein